MINYIMTKQRIARPTKVRRKSTPEDLKDSKKLKEKMRIDIK